MNRNFAAKPVLVVIGTAALAVLGTATLTTVYVSAQNSHRAAYGVRPAGFEQFDASASNASIGTGADSPEVANAALPQSGDGVASQMTSPDGPAAVESFDERTSEAGEQAQPYGQEQQIRQPQAQYGQQPQYGQGQQNAAGSAGGWTALVSPDHSATIAIPADWRIAGGGKGAVAVEGPSSEQVILGIQTYVTPNQAPYMSPVQALGWFMQTHGARLIGVQEHTPQQARSGQVELIIGESELQGRKYKLVARVTTAQIGMGNWMLQVSSMGAPVEHFDAVFPTMQKIWNSWNLDPGYVQNAFQQAAAMNQQTAQNLANGAMARFNSWKPFHVEMSNTLNGISVMENQSTGQRHDVPIGSERTYLNNCTRNGQDCRQVPASDLVPPQ